MGGRLGMVVSVRCPTPDVLCVISSFESCLAQTDDDGGIWDVLIVLVVMLLIGK